MAAVTALALGTAACSSSGSSAGDTDATTTGASTTVPATTLRIVVTNDDGYEGAGIDALVQGLQKLPKVEIHVVAPASDQSGQGNATTPGFLVRRDATTLSGYPAVAVQGHPADTIRAALDDLHLQPDLVVSGINKGQNVGPIVDVSGTVGAARAAAARGIPALAVSQGLGDPIDYAVATNAVLNWISQHRASLHYGTTPLPTITNMNAPSCGTTGKLKGTVTVQAATAKEFPLSGASQALVTKADCSSDLKDPANDVVALNAGYVAITEIPSTPAAS